jgi:hypothetical protein
MHTDMYKALFTLLGILSILVGCATDQSSNITPQPGQGGSMARFAITGDALYIVDHQSLIYYDITNPADPTKKGQKSLDMGIETIFPYQDNLFVGASDGMYIFENKNPLSPQLLSRFRHVLACDPVVAQDNYAYVTLRSGTECRNGINSSSLDVVDISDLTSPKLVSSTALSSPYGLGVSGKTLFVCEGDNGLRIFNLEDPSNPVLKTFHKEIPAYDVIVRNSESLIVTGKKGLYQFSFGEAESDFNQLSLIPVN